MNEANRRNMNKFIANNLRIAADIIEHDLQWQWSELGMGWVKPIYPIKQYIKLLADGGGAVRIKPENGHE